MKRGERAAAARGLVELIEGLVRSYRLEAELGELRAVGGWGETVGPRVAARTRALRVEDGVLRVEVANSAWLHELNLMKPQLRAQLVARASEPGAVHDIRFELAGRHRREETTVPRARAKQPGPVPAGPPATGARREQIVAETAAVDDDELRELIARVRITNDR